MRHSVFEVAMGALVLLGAAGFLAYGSQVAQVRGGADYQLTANFATVGALQPGDPVRISGVKVGTVGAIVLDPATYAAQVTVGLVVPGPLPVDTSAAIMSDSLMGGVYLSITPGGDESTLPSGARIAYTQSPQNLEQLLGKFIFSSQQKDGAADDG